MYDHEEETLEEALTKLVKLGLLSVEINPKGELGFVPTDLAFEVREYLA